MGTSTTPSVGGSSLRHNAGDGRRVCGSATPVTERDAIGSQDYPHGAGVPHRPGVVGYPGPRPVSPIGPVGFM